MTEVWKDILGYEGKYQVSNTGKVKSLHYHRSVMSGDRCLIPRVCKIAGRDQYPYVVLSKDNKTKTFKVHRLVAEYFIPNPDNKPYVNHKDGNKENNNVENLEWVTPLENNLHAYHVLKKHPMKGFKFDKNKLSKKVVQYYVSEEGHEYKLAVYANAQIAGQINNVHPSSINACCNHKKNYGQVGGYKWEFEEEGGLS